jgi:hypothetical protein
MGGDSDRCLLCRFVCLIMSWPGLSPAGSVRVRGVQFILGEIFIFDVGSLAVCLGAY